MMSEGREYSDECEYELSVNCVSIKILEGKYVSVCRSVTSRPKLVEAYRSDGVLSVIVLSVHVFSVQVLEERCWSRV